MTDLQTRSLRRTASLAGAAAGVLTLVLAGTFASSAQAATDQPSTKQTVSGVPAVKTGGCIVVVTKPDGGADGQRHATSVPAASTVTGSQESLPICADAGLIPVK